MASRILKLAAVAVLVTSVAGSSPADTNGTSLLSLDVNITVDGEAVPFARCYITGASLRNLGDGKQVRLNIKVHASSPKAD